MELAKLWAAALGQLPPSLFLIASQLIFFLSICLFFCFFLFACASNIVAICEAPDDETATTLALSVAARGNVRSETSRAFSLDEVQKTLGRMV